MLLVNSSSTKFFAKTEAGGKGYNLYLLTQAGLPVPPWLIFGRSFLAEFLNETKMTDPLDEILTGFRERQVTGDATEAQILDLFLRTGPTESLRESVSRAFGSFTGDCLFSVRSSAADEDSAQHSFAGQLSSFLYVQGEADVMKYILRCWASAYSARSLAYRLENKLDFHKISVAVILQKMLDPSQSGVLFTCDPVKQSLSHFVVSSVYGVGEGLVSGLLDADSFWLDPETGKISHQEIVEKKEKLQRKSSGECQTEPVEDSLISAPSLSSPQLVQLWELGKKIFELYGQPQDIEWAIEGNEIFILQTRPVTGFDSQLVGYLNLWDNSNIVESYGGLTSPLSFSFALRNYRNVYVQFCEILGVPSEIIKDMDSYLSYMLGCIRGRVYYNLFNWYKLIGVLPGFSLNREFMETMMGVQEGLDAEVSDRIRPHPSWETPLGRIRKMVTGVNFVIYHFRIQSIVDDFLRTFHHDYDYFRRLPLSQMRSDQLIQIYTDLERKMLGRWKAPIINDFLCMVHFGLLRKLTLKWLQHFDGTIQNSLLSGEGGLESAEPTKVLLELAVEASTLPRLKSLLLETSPSLCLESLNQSEFQDFYRKIQSYLDKFGFRCMSEMKLEEIDFVTDPSTLFVYLKNYLRSDRLESADGAREREVRLQAEARVRQELPFLKRLLYFWVLKHARKAVKNRENTRFARTRVYGLARTIFNQIGENLAAQGVLAHPRDIFWLSIEEVFGIFHGTLSAPDLGGLVNLRRQNYESFDEDPNPRILTRGPVYWMNDLFKPEAPATNEGQAQDQNQNPDDSWDLKGLPCCPGILEGTVKVVLSPSDNLELNGEILVTARTDPGWVPLYPSISGLLVERGSLLSHSAIVAREMGKPSIVSIPGLTKTLKSGMRIRMDGQAGTVKIL